MLYSLGCKYKVDENMELGASYLYDYKRTREIDNPDNTTIDGKFEDAGAHVVTMGMIYKF
jgi:long-chain fatty acid transport protein